MRPLLFNGALLGASRAGTGGLGTVSISNVTTGDTTEYPTAALAFYTLASNGARSDNDGSDSWLLGSASGSLYEVRATATSGTPTSGTTGSWLALSSTRTWSVSRSSLGTKTCTLTIEIRDAATQTVQDAASITLSATVNPSA